MTMMDYVPLDIIIQDHIERKINMKKSQSDEQKLFLKFVGTLLKYSLIKRVISQ